MSQGKPTDVLVKEVKVSFEPVQYRSPLKFGGRVVSSTFLMNTEATVEARNGKRATGHGSMPLGNVWAWPSATLEPAQTELLIRAFAEEVVELFNSYPDYGHPLEIELMFPASMIIRLIEFPRGWASVKQCHLWRSWWLPVPWMPRFTMPTGGC